MTMTMTEVAIPIDCVLLGTVRPFGPKGVPSGIDKQAVDFQVPLLSEAGAGRLMTWNWRVSL